MKTKSLDVMSANILTVYSSATAEQRLAGRDWYADAHTEAKLIALDTPYSIEQIAGALAAVSPRLRWEKNVELAQYLVDLHRAGLPLRGYMKGGLNIVQHILDGIPVLSVLTGQKRRAFFECIRVAGQTDMVCVDRHAMSVAYGCTVPEAEQGMTPKQYGNYVSAYQFAARSLNMPAAVLQAITWVAWRER